MVYYPSFAYLNIFKVSLLQAEATEIESIGLVGCYTTWLKDGTVINISVETSMHIPIFIPVKGSFFLKGYQKFWGLRNDEV